MHSESLVDCENTLRHWLNTFRFYQVWKCKWCDKLKYCESSLPHWSYVQTSLQCEHICFDKDKECANPLMDRPRLLAFLQFIIYFYNSGICENAFSSLENEVAENNEKRLCCTHHVYMAFLKYRHISYMISVMIWDVAAEFSFIF